jgi:hypothetical protein
MQSVAAEDVRGPGPHRADRGWKGFVNDFLDGLSGEDPRQPLADETQGGDAV